MIIIDGETFDVPITDLDMEAAVLDKYAERTEDGELHREIIGVYFNYTLKFGSSAPVAEYARLWEKLTEPAEFHTVTLPDEDGDFTFQAYISGVRHKLRRDKGAAQKFWKDLTAKFIAKSPART